jgi:hypothetical protein
MSFGLAIVIEMHMERREYDMIRIICNKTYLDSILGSSQIMYCKSRALTTYWVFYKTLNKFIGNCIGCSHLVYPPPTDSGGKRRTRFPGGALSPMSQK